MYGDVIELNLINVHIAKYCTDVIKSVRMRWAAHVSRMEGTRNAYTIFIENPQKKRRCWAWM